MLHESSILYRLNLNGAGRINYEVKQLGKTALVIIFEVRDLLWVTTHNMQTGCLTHQTVVRPFWSARSCISVVPVKQSPLVI